MATESNGNKNSAPLSPQYDVISIDTNIFDRYRLRFDSGLLSALTQFREATSSLILSAVVIAEVRKHLIELHQTTIQKLRSAARTAGTAQIVPDELVAPILGTAHDLEASRTYADSVLSRFLEDTGALVIRADHVSGEQLAAMYFATEPPFEEPRSENSPERRSQKPKQKSKKHEFPDAIALLSLESYATAKNLNVLVVSNDRGWKKYADKSHRLDVRDDLAACLQQFQDAFSEDNARHLHRFLSSLDGSGLLQQALDLLKVSIQGAFFSVEFSSADPTESDWVAIEDASISILSPEDSEAEAVAHEGDTFTASIPVHVEVQASCVFEIFKWDSVDKELSHMNSQTHRTTESFDTFALIKSRALDSPLHPRFEVMSATVSEADLPALDFGEVELDFGPPDDE